MRVRLLQLDLETGELAHRLLAVLPAPFRRGELVRHDISLSGCIDRTRGQADAAWLLERIPRPESGWANLVLLRQDLFLPALTYVFGASELGRGRAVLSWARLIPEERPIDLGVVFQRLRIEAAHELGHSAGLRHCPVPACPMHRTLWPEAIELKGTDYCPVCRNTLDARFEGFDPG